MKGTSNLDPGMAIDQWDTMIYWEYEWEYEWEYDGI